MFTGKKMFYKESSSLAMPDDSLRKTWSFFSSQDLISPKSHLSKVKDGSFFGDQVVPDDVMARFVRRVEELRVEDKELVDSEEELEIEAGEGVVEEEVVDVPVARAGRIRVDLGIPDEVPARRARMQTKL